MLEEDKHLIEQAKRGHQAAFGLLVLKYQIPLARAVRGYLRDHQEVMDVTQETFLKAYRHLGDFRGECQFYTWLYRIARNTALSYVASQQRRPPYVDVDFEEAQWQGQGPVIAYNDPAREAIRDEIGGALEKAIASLPPHLGQTLWRRELKGERYEEIAAAMDCPVGTVRSRLFRAREILQNQMKALFH